MLHRYQVTYAIGAFDREETRTVIVEALDAIDAKHVAEFGEGAVIVWASARKLRS